MKPFNLVLALTTASSTLIPTDIYSQNPSANLRIIEYAESTPTQLSAYIEISKKINMDILDGFLLLQQGWNGYNGRSFSTSVIERAKRIVLSLERQPYIFPTGRNSVQIEYRKPNRDYLEFEIYSNKIEFYIYKSGHEEERKVKSYEIAKIVEDFYA